MPTKEWGIFFLFFGLVLINHCKNKKKPENIEYTLIHRVDWSILVKRDHIIYNFVKLKIIKMCFVYIALNSTMTWYSFLVYNNAHKVEYVHVTLIWYQYTKISNRRVAMYNYVIDSFFIHAVKKVYTFQKPSSNFTFGLDILFRLSSTSL